ncbi:hypothetical protein TNIN_159811 [Trichonephila inaurata madagascariensis]|uniref:Uncharacterized protein n=1 Tax=Trichonephila inaurata madagascariensis TaxID=2747483 RepID=A0A8X6WZA9_9ARAC|nr:hypothetical protein TNIN_159811 [Trichonephila inaurata madagascariensis]
MELDKKTECGVRMKIEIATSTQSPTVGEEPTRTDASPECSGEDDKAEEPPQTDASPEHSGEVNKAEEPPREQDSPPSWKSF